ncbi:type III pantothenate kinase [[Mycoplasma] testudinis]|uniref:type III pantothenate kinase n=1 Tax=[Mycoplasma] testudinis TaxID=33924 RepID=UPI0004870084|nr:type III pantothenate kinase [[Mycoplasma] testudinis]
MIKNLYIDIGNTFTKFGIYDQIQKTWHICKLRTSEYETSSTVYVFLKNNLETLKFDYLIISSVVPYMDIVMKELNSQYLKVKMIFLNGDSDLPIRLDNINKHTIGADILACAIYASNYHKEAVVVSFGTATVLTHMKDKKIIGTAIAPGVYSSYLNLVSKAAKLSNTPLKKVKSTSATNTQEALSIGFINGFKHLACGLAKAMSPNAKLLVTGGDASLIKDIENAEYIENLVLQGLEIFFNKMVLKNG